MKKFERFIVTFMSIFMIVFSVSFFAKIIVDAIIFGQKSFTFKYIYLDLLVVAVVSILLTLFYQINKMTTSVQALVTYITILTVIYIFGYFSGWFSMRHIYFLLISLSFNVVGLVSVVVFLLLKHRRQNDELNEQLASFKERGQNEEN